MEYPGIAPEIGTKIKELTVAGNDPAGKKEFTIGTPEGRCSAIPTGNIPETRLYYECPWEQLPWAYVQFGLQYEEPCNGTD